MGVLVAAVAFWFSHLAPTSHIKSGCLTPSKSTSQAIEARMHDGRARVDHVRVVEAGDSRYESLFFTSANVRIAGVAVGMGTWASNFRDFGPGDFRGWADTPKYYSLSPVNDLARAIASDPGVLMNPGMTQPARYSQACVQGVGPSD